MSDNPYPLLKMVLDFIGTIIWPVVVLIIVLYFKNDIKKLIDKAKKIGLPGGISIEAVDEDIDKAKELATEIKTERKPERQSIIDLAGKNGETKANRRMLELGLEPSPSGLDLNYYKKIADLDLRLALVGLRIDFEIILKNLAKGFKIELTEKESVNKIITKLLDAGAITSRQYEFINIVFKITNAAAHGASISKYQVDEVLEIGQVLIDDYVAWLDWGFKN
jgi:hypothetical protein